MEQAFAWCDYVIDVLEEDAADEILPGQGESSYIASLTRNFESKTISTAYSGVGAPETALCMLHEALQRRTGNTVRKPRVLYCIEWLQDSQEELRLHPAHDDDTCIFGDIAEFFTDSVKQVVDKLIQNPANSLDILGPAVKTGKAVRSHAFCKKHQKMCKALIARIVLRMTCGLLGHALTLACFRLAPSAFGILKL